MSDPQVEPEIVPGTSRPIPVAPIPADPNPASDPASDPGPDPQTEPRPG